jgi:hypothetical protein
MAKVIERLDDTKIKKAIKGAGKITSAAYLPDGKGLYLRVTPGGTSTFPYRWFHKGSQLAHRPPQQRLRYARRRRSRASYAGPKGCFFLAARPDHRDSRRRVAHA